MASLPAAGEANKHYAANQTKFSAAGGNYLSDSASAKAWEMGKISFRANGGGQPPR
jgi:hypothetical protein